MTRDQVREIAGDQDGRPQRQRRRGRDAPDRGHRPQHGHRGRRLAPLTPRATGRATRRTPTPRQGGGRARPDRQEEPHHGSTARSTSRRRSSSIATASTRPTRRSSSSKQTTTVAFDASIEAHLRLGVDPRHADQMVRGTVVLPHGTGKIVRVAVFAQGEKAQEALRAGADEVGGEDLVKKIEAGWLEFDVALATPDSMGLVGKLGKILGRRGLMPNPKAGTITFDLERAIKEVKAGRVEFKVDKAGIVHVAVGKSSFEPSAAASTTWRRSSTRSTARSRPAPRASTSRPSRSPARWARASGSTCPASSRPRPPDTSAAGGRRPPDAMTAERPRHLIQTDGPPQTACARGPPTPRRARDGRGLIRRTGPATDPRGDGTGDDDEHAEADRCRSTFGWAAPLRVGVDPPTGGRHGTVAGAARSTDRAPTAARRPRAEATGGPHADRGQARDGRRAARGTRRQPDDDRLRVPRPQGEGDRRDPARPAQAGRDLPRRQEPPDADRRRGCGRRGARPAPDRARRRSRSGTTRPGPPRPSSMRPARTPRSSGSPAASSATGRSTPTT